MTDIVEVQGLTELRKLLNSEEAIKHAKIGLKTAAANLKEVLVIYPGTTAGNQPRGFNTVISPRTGKFINTWYERNKGSRWARKDGTIGSRDNSEKMSKKWAIKSKNAGLTQEIGAYSERGADSYFPLVMDADKQTIVHQSHGWKTVQTIAKQEEDRLVKVIRDEIAKAFHTK